MFSRDRGGGRRIMDLEKQGERNHWLRAHVAGDPGPHTMRAYHVDGPQVICSGRRAAFRHEPSCCSIDAASSHWAAGKKLRFGLEGS